ncbi:MAG: ATP-binding protein [Halothiobacillaceae bacterium]|nr:ATP-binding protein [Halothiobacillaceae bacterium]
MSGYQQTALWKGAFSPRDDGFDKHRTMLVVAFEAFRERVMPLVAQIHKDMPDLTVHDITHIDALWQTASEIAGASYPLNPAEAFVLGGAFLLHDAAHCVAAYPGGMDELKQQPEWQDCAALRGVVACELIPGTPEFQMVMFDVLRALHPKRARNLAKLSWKAEKNGNAMFLLEHEGFRDAYAEVIGLVAESHWWTPHELEGLAQRIITAPTCLKPAPWSVDVLKLAVLMRTADAAHIDAQRAPRFLRALIQPGASSLAHWQFQGRMHQVQRDPDPKRFDLRISASAFPLNEQEAWWLAYDAVCLMDKELRAADRLLLDHPRPERERLAVRGVSAAHSPEDFARSVPTQGWQPVDASIKIGDVQTLVERFGGEKLYGEQPVWALRELLQNAIDAVDACRKLGGLDENGGKITVEVEHAAEAESFWLHVTDTGIGMSRYVLTEVLLDFGHSLWRSPAVRGEWTGLAATGFEAIGQFGIGFFAVFMLGEQVRVTTRRFESIDGENNQWVLEFGGGIRKRPVLRKPEIKECLKRHGTRVSVLISAGKYAELCADKNTWRTDPPKMTFSQTCAWLAPASAVDLYVKEPGGVEQCVVHSNDWKTLAPLELLQRIEPGQFENQDLSRFGAWSHIGELRRSDGSLAGRCAASAMGRLLRDGLGVGVVKGLRAGHIEGMAGIIVAQAQTDLARKTALPLVSLSDLKKWADEQKTLISGQKFTNETDPLKIVHQGLSPAHVEVDGYLSWVLALYGADYAGLTLGRLGSDDVAFEGVADRLRKPPELDELVVFVSGITHLSVDGVLSMGYNFEPLGHVLGLYQCETPAWLEKLDAAEVDRKTWSLTFALEQLLKDAWGEVEWSEGVTRVGFSNDVPIGRECRVATKARDLAVPDVNDPPC